MAGTVIARVQKSLQRRINQLRAYDYPEESAGWHKYEHNPILGDDQTGSIFDPFVRKVDQEYVMCLSCRVNHSIMMFYSEDGFHWDWESGIEILKGVADSDWESRVNRACFLRKDNIWHLWYTGQNEGKSKIGYAVSDDGVHYVRKSFHPVLTPEYSFEGENVMNPCVLWDTDKACFRMWYAAGENYEPDVICYAESDDGIKWRKKTQPILYADKNKTYQRNKVGACDVVRSAQSGYIMAYIAYQNVNVARICLAHSDDGISGWKEYQDEPIIAPGRAKWDSHAVYKPTLCVDIENGRTFLWYNGRTEHRERIGAAILDCII